MKSTALLVLGALVTAALVGVGADAQAYTGHSPSTSHHHKRLEQDGSSRVLRALGRLDRRLVHATSAHRLAPLTDADRDALQNSAEADEAAVGAVATAYSANPSDAHRAAAEDVLRGYRAVRYVRATNILRHSERTAARLAVLQPLVAVGSDDEAALAAALALLAGVPPDGFTATTDRDSMHAARLAVASARALVGEVQDDLATP